MRTVLLLLCSNVFMTIAWYGHLRFKDVPYWKVFIASWLIAGFEYLLMIPANRLGYEVEGFTAFQLKTIQEIISLVVFCVFAVVYLHEPLKWNYAVGFVFLVLAAVFIFRKW
ncbi:MAG TPA: DMT family protein [Luteibaculaceae bacterium]|jgi:uncharacterized protein|nr:DMT family protein [Luteibaculaceae bacterium]